MIDWLTIAWKAPPLAAGAVRTWWRRDTSRNLSRAVVRTIDTRGNWPSGLREELVAQWWSVRDDEIVASLVRDLLDDPSRELEQHLRKRLRELLDGLILNLGSEETADRLAWIVIDQLSIAQKTSALQNRADHRRTQGMLGELTDKVETLSESLAVGSGPPPDANLVLPGDLNEDQERAIATFAETDSRLAAKLAALVTSSGVAALDGLLSVLPAWARDAPPQFWAAVSVLASDAGRHATALAAARREADEPTADRAAALVRAARAAYASGDDTLGDDLAHDAGVLEPDHPATLLLAAGRASDHTERLELAERARPRTKRQHAEQQAQRAFALIGLDRFDEAEEAAAESTKLDPHGNGLEAGYLLPIYRAVIAFPEMTVEPQLLGRCAAWFLERVPENRAAGRATYAGVAASRAATALAVAGDVDRVRALIDDALAKNEVLAPEAVSNFGAAAQIINDSERLLAVVPAAASDGARLQRAIAQLDARVDELQAANVLEELAGSSDSDIARDAATARVMASAYLALPLPEHLADHLHDDDRMFAYVRAQRAAQDGDFPKAQQELATFADPQSLALRIEMAEEAGEFTKAIHLSEKLFEEQPSGVQRLRLAAVRSRAGDLADARDDALVVARDQREVDGVRRRAFAFAAEWANEEGNFPAMEALTTEWLALDSTTPDATWWKAYALLRQHRYTEALQTLDAANATAQTDTQARVLAQALVFATIDPIERLQRLDALSDERGRPEWFEFNLITAVLHTPPDTRPDGQLEARIRRTYADFGTRFPDSTLIRVIKVDDSDPAGSLFRALEQYQPDADHQQRVEDATAAWRNGTCAIAVLASLIGGTTLTVVLDGDPLPLAVPDPMTRDEERRAAEQALHASAASWDSSAIAVVANLPNGLGPQLRGLLAASVVGQATLDEINSGDGIPQPDHADDTSELAQRRSAARRAADLAGALTLTADMPGGPRATDAALRDALASNDPSLPFRALVSAINVAKTRRLPLYSDDRAVRTLARGSGVSAFGTLALIEAALEAKTLSEHTNAAILTALADRGAWGLEFDADTLVARLRARGLVWDAGAAAAFSDVLAHRQPPRGLVSQAAAVLLTVSEERPDALAEWTRNVVEGFFESLGIVIPDVVSLLLPATLDPIAPPNPTTDAARARAVRSLRELDEVRLIDHDPLLDMLNQWMKGLADERIAAALFSSVINRVDERDRELLFATFVRD